MRNLANVAVAGVLGISLAACGSSGGGSSGGGGGGTPDPVPLTFAEYSELLDDIDAATAGLSAVEASDLATTGSATYNGVVTADLFKATPEELTLFGALELTANFETNAVTGSVSEFVDSNEDNYTGQMMLENGTIDRSVNQNDTFLLSADLEGTITAPDGTEYSSAAETATTAPDAFIAGEFLGEDETAIVGTFEGNFTSEGTDVTLDDGVFIATK